MIKINGLIFKIILKNYRYLHINGNNSNKTENKDEICLLHVFGPTVECTRICTGVSLERRNREIKSSPVSKLIVVLLFPASPPARPCIEKLAYSKYAYETFYKKHTMRYSQPCEQP